MCPLFSAPKPDDQSGFGFIEFLLSALIFLLITAFVFSLLSEIQRKTSYQAEVQSVLDNTRIAMLTVGRYLRQAGNDPQRKGFAGITLMNSSQIGIASDITGSDSPGNPDKGDPDGDILDSGEDIVIRYNSATRSLEVVPNGGSAQVVAGNISGISFLYFDSEGNPPSTGTAVCRVKVTIHGASLLADPDTHQIFGVQLCSEFQISG